MEFKKAKKFLLILAALYWILAAVFYFSAGERFRTLYHSSTQPGMSAFVGEILDGQEIRQTAKISGTEITSIDLIVGTYGRVNQSFLKLRIESEDGTILGEKKVSTANFPNNEAVNIKFDKPVQIQARKPITLVITTEGSVPGNGIAIYYGNPVSSGRIEVEQKTASDRQFTINGVPGGGKLCVSYNSTEHTNFYINYWIIVVVAFAITAVLCRIWWKQILAGKGNPLYVVCLVFTKYGFLIKQLVSRDFKVKYKKSSLGMIWSFMNPLLTMGVQYLVFATLFKSGTPNYAVYLLSGIVIYSYFSEATSLGMWSIVGNASLIKKVYIPKYIYPMTRVMSGSINLFTSFCPLLLVILITGLKIKVSFFLLIYDFICLTIFIMGMVLILATCMTFFQDTQFLWSVVSMLWMYMTPLFYMETIIPENLLPLYRMNPMYQYITFARICIIDGISPPPISYLWCLLLAVGFFSVGVYVFKKNQQKFVMYM